MFCVKLYYCFVSNCIATSVGNYNSGWYSGLEQWSYWTSYYNINYHHVRHIISPAPRSVTCCYRGKTPCGSLFLLVALTIVYLSFVSRRVINNDWSFVPFGERIQSPSPTKKSQILSIKISSSLTATPRLTVVGVRTNYSILAWIHFGNYFAQKKDQKYLGHLQLPDIMMNINFEPGWSEIETKVILHIAFCTKGTKF